MYTMLSIRTATNKARQSITLLGEKLVIREKTFLKVQNRQLGMMLVSGYIFEYGNSR